MRKATALVLNLFVASAAFALLALLGWTYPLVESFSTSSSPICAYEPSLSGCSVYEFYEYCAEVAEGLAAVAVLLILFQTKDRLSKAMPSVTRALTHRMAVPRNTRRVVLFLSVIGAIAFSVTVFVDVGYNVPSLADTSRWILFNYIDLHGIYLSMVAFPIAAMTTLGFTVYKLEDGPASALKWAFKTFALPATTALEVGILVFDLREIALSATKFVPWSLYGIYLVSNWFVLIVSVSLLAMLVLTDGRKALPPVTPTR